MDISTLNVRIDISILRFFYLNSKTYFIKKMIFEFWIVVVESRINILIPKLIDWVLRLFSTVVMHDESFL